MPRTDRAAPPTPRKVSGTSRSSGTTVRGGKAERAVASGPAAGNRERGVKAIEAFGDAKFGEADEETKQDGCVAPVDFFLSVGFKTVRPHPRYPRLRLELRTALSWKSDVEYALEKLLGSMSPEALLRPVRPVTATRTAEN